MGPEVIITHPAFVAQVILMMLFLLPDFSLVLWKNVTKQCAACRAKILLKRNRRTEEKLRQYWVIDLRKPK